MTAVPDANPPAPGDPDLQLGPLRLWVHRYEFDDSATDEDLDWLVAMAIRPADSLGHFHLTVELTPAHLTQQHRFEQEIDQTELEETAVHCARILRRFPARG